jgi:integrase
LVPPWQARGYLAEPLRALVKRMAARWRDLGMEPLGLHEAQHTFASLLIDAGANAKAISTYMGHASISITFDRYGHLMPG